jgi:ribosome maturation factor RimP
MSLMQEEFEDTLSSPISAVSLEETRILTDYISKQNLFKIIGHDESLRRPLILKKFFKKRRDQQVVVTSASENNETVTTEGKVAAVGRDFVMLTNLQKRIWIPFVAIESATIPFGYPSYSNTHQHAIYDNQLQQKLILQFGETVAKKEALIQQFFEESMRTNFTSWKDLWVEVKTAEETFIGKIKHTTKKELFLKQYKKELVIQLNDIRYVSTVRVFSIWRKLLFKGRNS